MKTYFYVFIGVSLVIFLLVMRQIQSAVVETNREVEYWTHFEIPLKR